MPMPTEITSMEFDSKVVVVLEKVDLETLQQTETSSMNALFSVQTRTSGTPANSSLNAAKPTTSGSVRYRGAPPLLNIKGKLFKCPDCVKLFGRLKQLSDHRLEMHLPTGSRLGCGICGIMYDVQARAKSCFFGHIVRSTMS